MINEKNKQPTSKVGVITPKKDNLMGYLADNKDLLSKIGIYSANYFGELFTKINNASYTIGNAYGAVGYLTLDLLVQNQPQLKKNKLNRLSRVGGSLFYLGAGAYNLVSALIGDWQENVASALFDFSMSYQLDRDVRGLYDKLNSGEKEETKQNAITDLKEILGFKSKEDSSKTQSLEGKTSEGSPIKKDNSKSFKKYLSDFGKNALETIELGAGFGYGFGKSAFEKLKENYSKKNVLLKRAKRIKKIRKDNIAQETAQKNRESLGFEKVSFKKKKEILEYCGKNLVFMREYEIENDYAAYKQKPIDEQIKIMTDQKNSLKEDFKQMKNAPWIKRFKNQSYISDTESSLKKIEEILRKLDIEKKNPPQRPIDKYK